MFIQCSSIKKMQMSKLEQNLRPNFVKNEVFPKSLRGKDI